MKRRNTGLVIVAALLAGIVGCDDGAELDAAELLTDEQLALQDLVLTEEEEFARMAEGLDTIQGPGSDPLEIVDDTLLDCKWVKSYSTTTEAKAVCPAGRYVVSGGCFFQGAWTTELTLNKSYEWGNVDNTHDPGQDWKEPSGENGWACRSNSTTSDRLYANALCCVPNIQ